MYNDAPDIEKGKKLFLAKESRSPVIMYPCPSVLDCKMCLKERRAVYDNFCKWERDNIRKLELLINLAVNIKTPKRETGLAVVTTIDGQVFLAPSLLSELPDRDKKPLEDHDRKTLWAAVRKHILTKRELLRKFVESAPDSAVNGKGDGKGKGLTNLFRLN
jgi:hypothetical protein